MQAIQVKTLPATNTKPTRLKAWCQAKSKTVSYGYTGMAEESQQLATDLANELEWLEGYRLVFGSLPNGDTVAVLTEDKKGRVN